MRNRILMLFTLAVLIVFAVIALPSCGFAFNPPKTGERHESSANLDEEIKSTEITEFSFKKDGEYSLCLKKVDELHCRVEASGGSEYNRDGTAFLLKYDTDDMQLLDELKQLISERNLSRGNGHIVHVDGLPDCGGETLSVRYQSGEKIYKSDNSGPIMSAENSQAIYDAFLKDAQRKGLDFTTEGSNQTIYDDADEDYVQGTWMGTHFGDECRVVFSGKNVKIYIGGELADDCDYTIIDGSIVPDNGEEYPQFSTLNTMKKTNSFTITGYFYRPSYSTVSLLKQDD